MCKARLVGAPGLGRHAANSPTLVRRDPPKLAQALCSAFLDRNRSIRGRMPSSAEPTKN